MTKSIVLVGMMGAGKSTIGKLLAEKCQRPFVDIDMVINHSTGLTPAEIFTHFSEAGFRALEYATHYQQLQQPAQIIASGGGAFCHPSTQQLLLSASHTIWLDVAADTLWRRLQTAASHTRPLLGSYTDFMERYQQRLPEYRKAAMSLTISAHESADHTVERLRSLIPV